MKITSLIIDNVSPTLEEITKFSSGSADGVDPAKQLATFAQVNISYSGDDFGLGENVSVIQGDQSGLHGVVTSVESGIVFVKPDASLGLHVGYNTFDIMIHYLLK